MPGKNFAQDQMGGKKGDEPQRAQPHDDIKVLIDPTLRLLVVEAVKIIDVDWNIRVAQVRSGRGRKKVADESQPCSKAGPSGQAPLVVAQAEQQPDKQQRQPAMKKRKPAREQRQMRIEHITGQTKREES